MSDESVEYQMISLFQYTINTDIVGYFKIWALSGGIRRGPTPRRALFVSQRRDRIQARRLARRPEAEEDADRDREPQRDPHGRRRGPGNFIFSARKASKAETRQYETREA